MFPDMNANEFDVIDELDRTLKTLGLSRDEAVSELVVDGRDPLVPSTIRLGSAMGIALLSAAVGAAQIWQASTGRPQRLGLDLGQALHQLTPYLGGGNTLNGYGSNMGSVLGLDGALAPALWDLYRTADDRWAIPIACYPNTRDTFLDLLGTAHTREHIGAAIAGRISWELEEEAAARGVPLAIVRSREEFLAHPQGKAVLAEPLVSVERVGDAPPRPLRPAPSRCPVCAPCSSPMSSRAPRPAGSSPSRAPTSCTCANPTPSTTTCAGTRPASACARPGWP
ncbi:hypothetical protein SALBM135S_04923 [Streptomyces alboniger]